MKNNLFFLDQFNRFYEKISIPLNFFLCEKGNYKSIILINNIFTHLIEKKSLLF
jgi:hypothetical protein